MDDKHRAYSEWLVLRCQQGKRSALCELLQIWQGRYFAYARYRLGEPEAAQDVLQEALLAICRNLHKLADPASFPRWSYTIVERRCLDWQRKRIRERQLFSDEAQCDVTEAAATESQTAIEASHDSRRLLASLNPELRALVRLYYLESFSVGEIAEILNLPSGTVKSRLFYARKQMQQFLETDQ